jgi:hypothetical protein
MTVKESLGAAMLHEHAMIRKKAQNRLATRVFMMIAEQK